MKRVMSGVSMKILKTVRAALYVRGIGLVLDDLSYLYFKFLSRVVSFVRCCGFAASLANRHGGQLLSCAETRKLTASAVTNKMTEAVRLPSISLILHGRIGSWLVSATELPGAQRNLSTYHDRRAAKAAVNQIIRTSAIELGRTHPELALIALHPGTVATKFSANYTARHPTQTPENAAQHMAQVIEAMTP